MNLETFYSKHTPAQHAKITVTGDSVIYDDGTKIYLFIIPIAEGDLLPLDANSRDYLNSL